MQEYNPMIDPNPEWWLSLDESERMAAVQKYHDENGLDVPDMPTHSMLHIVVENQVAMGELTPTGAVLCRLIDEKLDRHDAVHAIASVLVNHMHELLNDKSGALSNDEYYAALENLTAEKWSSGECW